MNNKTTNKEKNFSSIAKDTLSGEIPANKATDYKPFQWLNEHSRNFLAAGYLRPGLAPEQRVREIADRAEEILEMPGYADKFFNYMSQGFFSLASPVWSNFGKGRGLPISCFGSNVSDDMGNILSVSYTHLRAHET